ncbi:MAG: phosphoenolpyruvate synthase [Chloroflexi bacterium]|nr:MAG: phosphoenolpyruvate synthase [Chloroflexota bacterium]
MEQVGGKGASLARMAAAGLPVPPGFHITTAAYRRFVTENGLQEKILAAVSGVSAAVTADQPASLEEASRQIGRLFANSVMPDDIAEAIRQAYAELGGDDLPVAVRSSATAEDLPELSFAGQQETYLNMHGAAMVLEAVKRCWASLWTARAIDYRARHHIAQEEVSLAVVVQELVPAEAAGILFTANPLTGARDQVMINAAWGLGEAIVGGQVTPDTVVVDRASGAITEQEINKKDVMTVRTREGTHEEPVPAERRAQAVLSPAQAAELARIGVQIEDLYGQPMDIEWALHDGRVSVVQARPITALPALPEPAARSHVTPAAEWKLPNPKGSYIRSGPLELLPDPLSPLFATLGLHFWGRATGVLLKNLGLEFPDDLLITINGYGYYDFSFTPAQTAKLLLALPRLIATLPRLLRTSQARWQKSRSRYAKVVNRWQTTDLVTESAVDLLNGVREITAEAAQYYLSVQTGILPGAYMSELLFTIVYNRFLKKHNAPSALTFVLGFDSAPIQAEKSLYDLAQWVRGQPELVAALANMSSEQFTTAYREQAARAAAANGAWAEFWRRLADHLARYGHTIYDLDFAKAVLADDPAPVLEALKYFLSGKAPDPHARQEATAAAREQAVQTMLTRMRGMRLSLFRRLVGWAQSFAPLREDALADVGLGWPVLRRMLREIGRRLTGANVIGTPDDVFWLTLDELQGAAMALDAGQPLADSHAIVAERRATWESERAVTPPPNLPIKGGARFLGIDFSSTMPARADQPEGDVLKGIAASPGQITGPARVIAGPNEFDQMRQGDILVARITTPAWTPLFALAAGVVTDVGGPLSHSSIVAREYHIPAVLGTGMATGRLSSGQRVTVDGDAGTVTVFS